MRHSSALFVPRLTQPGASALLMRLGGYKTEKLDLWLSIAVNTHSCYLLICKSFAPVDVQDALITKAADDSVAAKRCSSYALICSALAEFPQNAPSNRPEHSEETSLLVKMQFY